MMMRSFALCRHGKGRLLGGVARAQSCWQHWQMQREAVAATLPWIVVARPLPLSTAPLWVRERNLRRSKMGLMLLLSDQLMWQDGGLRHILRELLAGAETLRRLLLLKRWMLLLSGWSCKAVFGALAMLERLRRLLLCLIDQLCLGVLCPRLLVCGIVDIVGSIWIRQRRGRASGLLEL